MSKISNKIQSGSSVEKNLGEFNLGSFLAVDAADVFTGKVVESYDSSGVDGLISGVVSIKDELSLIDNILALKDIDIVKFTSALLEYMGLGDLINFIKGNRDFLGALLNEMVGMVTAFGGSLLLRMELLGLINNDCKLDNHPSFIPSTASYMLFLGNLFKMLQCYGFGTAADNLLDLVDPLKEVEITPSSTSSTGVYTPAVMELQRSGKFNDMLAKTIPNHMDKDVAANIKSVSTSPYSDRVMLLDSEADTKMLSKVSPVHASKGADAFTDLVTSMDALGGTVNNRITNPAFRSMAEAKSLDRTDDINASDTIPLDILCRI